MEQKSVTDVKEKIKSKRKSRARMEAMTGMIFPDVTYNITRAAAELGMTVANLRKELFESGTHVWGTKQIVNINGSDIFKLVESRGAPCQKGRSE